MSRVQRRTARRTRTPDDATTVQPAGVEAEAATGTPGRGRLFAGLALVCLLVAGGYVAWAARRTTSAPSGSEAAAPVATSGAPAAAVNAGADAEPRVLFQHVARDDNYAKVALTPLRDPAAPRSVTPLLCERVYYAAERGICLQPKHGQFDTSYSAVIFGPEFRKLGAVPLKGIPSRTRVSPDGRYGAATVFVAGHSYADGNFSTQTLIIDIAARKVIGDVEKFAATKDGKRIQSPDFNYWGVTFTQDPNRFYATLRTRGKTYLVEGDVRAKTVRTLHENVECPSLSPDNTRVAYKKLVGEGPAWRLHVLDLETMQETPLAETRPVDDQVEWLDDGTLLYGMDADVWSVPADGSGKARRYLRNALSPAVVR